MKYFDEYVSNTTAGTLNQSLFESDGKERIGRVYYKLCHKGKFNYSFLFSNIVDSTFEMGQISHCNTVCDEWEITGFSAGMCDVSEFEENLSEQEMSDQKLTTVKFDGKVSKIVSPGEFFASDPIEIDGSMGEYLCLEIKFRGRCIPYNYDLLIPAYINNGKEWSLNKKMPLPDMVGCDRKVELKIGYLGDSITQGIGTISNSYTHWNSVLTEMLGCDNKAYWNMGIGYARSFDAASDGAWLFKAKHLDIVFICLGVNDLIWDKRSADKIEKDLTTTIDKLTQSGIKVVLQTVPPFGFSNESTVEWLKINEYIKNELKDRVWKTFDQVPILQLENTVGKPKYNDHPNAEGCRKWAEAIYESVKAELV